MSHFLKVERHRDDEISKELYLVFLDDKECVDLFMRRFFMLNRIDYNFKKRRWQIRKRRRIKKGV